MEKLDEVFAKYVSTDVVTEEAKKEISVVFEAMVNEKAESVIEERMKVLIEEAETKFNEAVEKNKEEMVENVDAYMDACVKEFMENNKVAIKNSITVEKAKNIINGLQKVFEENGIELPETNSDIVSEMNNKIETLNEKVNTLVEERYNLIKENEEMQKAICFIQETKDMSLIAKEKLMNLMKGLVVESVADFKSKLDIIKSNLVSEKCGSKVKKEEDDVEDMVEPDDSEDENSDDEKMEEKKAKKSVKEWMDKISALRN